MAKEPCGVCHGLMCPECGFTGMVEVEEAVCVVPFEQLQLTSEEREKMLSEFREFYAANPGAGGVVHLGGATWHIKPLSDPHETELANSFKVTEDQVAKSLGVPEMTLLEQYGEDAFRITEPLAVHHAITHEDVLDLYEACGHNFGLTEWLCEGANRGVTVGKLIVIARLFGKR